MRGYYDRGKIGRQFRLLPYNSSIGQLVYKVVREGMVKRGEWEILLF